VSYSPKKILLATDGSQDAASAARAAIDLSTRTGSELHVVHAWEALPPYAHPSVALATDAALYEREAQNLLFEQLDGLEAAGVEVAGAHLERGPAAEEIDRRPRRALGCRVDRVGQPRVGQGEAYAPGQRLRRGHQARSLPGAGNAWWA
jgi:nucleotide-binding universal stress UspA family protein